MHLLSRKIQFGGETNKKRDPVSQSQKRVPGSLGKISQQGKEEWHSRQVLASFPHPVASKIIKPPPDDQARLVKDQPPNV